MTRLQVVDRPVLFIVLCLSVACDASALEISIGGFRDLQASVIPEHLVFLEAGQEVAIQISNSSSGTKPEIHVLGPMRERESCEECQIVADQDQPHRVCIETYCSDYHSSGEVSDIAFMVPSSKAYEDSLRFTPVVSGTYRVVTFGSADSIAGTIDIKLNGSTWREKVAVGGNVIDITHVRERESIETVRVPSGGGPQHVIYELSPAGTILRRHISGGVGGAVQFEPKIGNSRLVIGVRAPGTPGALRLVRNDVLLDDHDSDGDGLGIELERSLGTCSSKAGIAAGRIPDWRYNILRFRTVQLCERVASDAEAAAKCIGDYMEFIDANRFRELACSTIADARDTDGDGISDGWEALGRKVEQVAAKRRLFFDQDDQLLPLWGADPRHKDLFVEVDFMLRQPGEVAKKMSPDVVRQFARSYQDEVYLATPLRRAFRAASIANPDGLPGVEVHLDIGTEAAVSEESTLYGDWGGYNAVPPVQKPGGYAGVNFRTAWKRNMQPSRMGIFRYALPVSDGGGQVPLNSFAWSFGIQSGVVFAHESGHGMGLGHSGAFGDTEPLDVNCKPNYLSLMNYAFGGGQVGFSDGQGTSPLNNQRAFEWEATKTGDSAFADLLEDVFKYWVDRSGGHVDWNRDGFIAPKDQAVAAYLNFRPEGSCEYTRPKESEIPNAASVQSPALARIKDRLYVFYSILGLLRYTKTTSSFQCVIESDLPCLEWSDWDTALLNAGGGVDVVRLVGFAHEALLLVVTIDNEGIVWESRMSVSADGHESFTSPVRVPNSSLAIGEPALVQVNPCTVMLVYKGQDLRIRHRTLTCADGWGSERLATTPNGQPIVTWEHASPGIGRAYLSHDPGIPRIYGAFPTNFGRLLTLFAYDADADNWEQAQVFDALPSEFVEGRPAMAWVPHSSSAEFPGRFYLTFIKHDFTPGLTFKERDREVRMLMSYVKVTTSSSGDLLRQERVGLNSAFDNTWHKALGIDLLFDSIVSKNLISVESRSSEKSSVFAKVQVRPFANGIVDLTYRNFNDWEVIRRGLCRNVVNPGDLVNDPIKCAN